MQESEFSDLGTALDLRQFTLGIINDLERLRAGQISVPDARARADLAKQALRAIGYIITAEKMIEQRALPPAAGCGVDQNAD